MVVKATVSDADALPEGVRLAVDLAEVSEEERALIEANLAEQEALLEYETYDVHFELDGVEIEPAQGTVSVQIQYKEALAAEQEEAAQESGEAVVFHLKEEEQGITVENVTDYVNAGENGDIEEVGFTTDSFSRFMIARPYEADRLEIVIEWDDNNDKDGERPTEASALLPMVLTYIDAAGQETNNWAEVRTDIQGIDMQTEDDAQWIYSIPFPDGKTMPTGGTWSFPLGWNGQPAYGYPGYVNGVGMGINYRFTFDGVVGNKITFKGKYTPVTWDGTQAVSAGQILGAIATEAPFGLVANEFAKISHMEANIAVGMMTENDGSAFGCTDHPAVDYKLTIKKTAPVKGADQSFTFGIFNGATKVQECTVTVKAGESEGVAEISGAFPQQVKNLQIYELDDSGAAIKPQSGQTADATIGGTDYKVSYDETSNGSIVDGNSLMAIVDYNYIFGLKGNAGLDTNMHPGLVIVGDGMTISESNGSTYVADPSTGANCLVSPDVTVRPETSSDTFHNAGDIAAALNTLSGWAGTLADAKKEENSGLRVVNVIATGDGWNSDVLPHLSASEKGKTGGDFMIGDGYMLLNLDLTGVSDYVLGPYDVNGKGQGNWDAGAGRVFINPVIKTSSGYAPYTGKLYLSGAQGTVIAPCAEIEIGNGAGTHLGSIYANKVRIHNELHKVIAGGAAEGTTTWHNETEGQEEETVTVSGTKTWEDDNNQDGLRPDSIEVKLQSRTDSTGQWTDVAGKTATVSAGTDGSWTYSFADLPEKENGTAIEYRVIEVNVPNGYTVSYEGNNIKNTHTSGKTSVSGTKTWEDDNNQDGLRPESIEVKLQSRPEGTQNWTDVAGKTATVSAGTDGSWTYSFTELPEKENGKVIEYQVVEVNVPNGYTASYEGNNIKNTHTSERGSLTLKKEVEGLPQGEYADKEYSFTVTTGSGSGLLYYKADGTSSSEQVVHKVKAGTSVTLSNLPVGDYQISELRDDVEVSGYLLEVTGEGKATVSKDQPKEVTVKNSYIKGVKAHVEGTKAIEDLSGSGNTDVAGYTFELTAVNGDDGTVPPMPETTTAVSAADGSFVFDDISFSEPGTYQYEIREIDDKKDGIIYDTHTAHVTIEVEEDSAADCLKATVDYSDGENTFTNQYQTETETSVNGLKQLLGRTLKANEFSFVIEAVSDDAPMPETTTVKNSADGSFAFGPIVYEKADVYRYKVKEVTTDADAAIIYDNTVYEFAVNVTGNAGKLSAVVEYPAGKNAFEFTNKTRMVEISKVDFESKVAVPGATFQVFDASGNTVGDAWESGTTPFTLTNLKAGEVYTLKEVKAPFGYETLKGDIQFKLDEDSKIEIVRCETGEAEVENGVLLVKDRMKAKEGQISVTKKVTLNGEGIRLDETYYAALFKDAEGKEICSEVKALNTKADSKDGSATVIFDKLALDTTYYIFETDAAGNAFGKTAVVSGLEVNVAVENQEIALSVGQREGAAIITNDYVTPPYGFTFVHGSLIVKKNVTVNGEETTGTKADGTYKFTVKSADGAYENEISLEIKNGKSAQVQLDNLDIGTYIVSEQTDDLADGISLLGDNDLEIEVSGDSDREIHVAEFTNNLDEEAEESESEKETEAAKKAKEVKTGDTTNYMIYVMLLLAAFGCLGGAIYSKKKRY